MIEKLRLQVLKPPFRTQFDVSFQFDTQGTKSEPCHRGGLSGRILGPPNFPKPWSRVLGLCLLRLLSRGGMHVEDSVVVVEHVLLVGGVDTGVDTGGFISSCPSPGLLAKPKKSDW